MHAISRALLSRADARLPPISSNATAHALYEKMGFRDYKETVVRVVEKTG